MPDFSLSKITEWLKLKPRYLFSLSVVSGFLLFSPENWLLGLGLDSLVQSYKGWIGGVFLISIVLLFTNIFAYLVEPIQGSINDWRRTMVYSKQFKTLSSEEKEVLKRYIEGDTQSQRLGMLDGIASGLAAKNILYRSSSLGTASGYIAYNIQPWAWIYLKKHPEILD